jgi:predicted ABC-type ATPase
MGYEVVLYFLTLPDANMAIERVKNRVLEGGHHIPAETVGRRFHAGLRNFHEVYRDIVDEWQLFDNRGHRPILLARRYNT